MQGEIQKILPRHLEIMRRLVLGQSQRDIAREMGFTEGRLSIIVNSPLFKTELKKMQRRREDQIFEIQEGLIEAAQMGVILHKAVLSNDDLPIPFRQRSATDVLNIVGRITKSSLPLTADAESKVPYEQRLREVVYREVTTTSPTSVPDKGNGGNGGNGKSASIFEADAIDTNEDDDLADAPEEPDDTDIFEDAVEEED